MPFEAKHMQYGFAPLALILVITFLNPDDDGPPASRFDRAGRLEGIRDEAVQLETAHSRALFEAETEQAKREVMKKHRLEAAGLRAKFAERALALAEENPRDQVGFEALLFVCKQSAPHGLVCSRAHSLMKEHHLSNPRIDEVLGELAGVSPDYDQQALRRVQKDNPARPARALAGFLIAKALREEADTRAQLELAARAFEGLAAEFGDVELKGKGESVAKLTKKEVSAIRLSPVGWVVRDIEGEDLDGQRFKLSDYRGKVVLLDFWGHW